VVKTLNKGAFAEVYQAIEISSGKAVALKVVSTQLTLVKLCFCYVVKTRLYVCK
jgi:serine/threonine protein kinase